MNRQIILFCGYGWLLTNKSGNWRMASGDCDSLKNFNGVQIFSGRHRCVRVSHKRKSETRSKTKGNCMYEFWLYVRCAEERTWTFTELPPLAPEASVSTNFTTSAEDANRAVRAKYTRQAWFCQCGALRDLPVSMDKIRPLILSKLTSKAILMYIAHISQ